MKSSAVIGLSERNNSRPAPGTRRRLLDREALVEGRFEEMPHVLDDLQRVRIHGVGVEQIELHLADDLAELGSVEQFPKMEGRQMTMVLAPKKK